MPDSPIDHPCMPSLHGPSARLSLVLLRRFFLGSRYISYTKSLYSDKMARKFFVGGNFKMNPTSREAKISLINALNEASLDPNVGG